MNRKNVESKRRDKERKRKYFKPQIIDEKKLDTPVLTSCEDPEFCIGNPSIT